MPKPVKKNSLFPIAYDEISLVDEGAAGSADVLISKRNIKKDRGPINGGSACKSCGALNSKNSTGAKDGKSKRGKNWKEERHPRDKDGKMKKTSPESKSKYGKDGTTQEKLERKCRSCRNKKRYKNKGRPVNKSAMSTAISDTHIRALLERK